MDDKFDRIGEKIDSVDERFGEKIDTFGDRISGKLDTFDDRISGKLDTFENRMHDSFQKINDSLDKTISTFEETSYNLRKVEKNLCGANVAMAIAAVFIFSIILVGGVSVYQKTQSVIQTIHAHSTR